jgi:uncharacterized phage protein (TIGR02218 family)
MKTLTPAAQLIIANRDNKAYFVDLYRITMSNGQVIRWTGGDVDVTWQGFVYSLGPALMRNPMTLKEGLENDSAGLTIYPKQTDTIGSYDLIEAFLSGLMDACKVEIFKGIAANPGDPLADAILRFDGKISSAEGDGSEIKVKLVSYLYKLDQPFPVAVYSPQCSNTLFDSFCSARKSLFEATGLVTASTADRMSITMSGVTASLGYYRAGVARFMTGANVGRVIRIKESSGNSLTFAQPWLLPIAIDDEILILPGCDKKLITCETKFNNKIHFRGQPFIPLPETVA